MNVKTMRRGGRMARRGGKAWLMWRGGKRLMARRGRGRGRSGPPRPVLIAGAGIAALAAFLGGRRRRNMVKGAAATVTSPVRATPDYDDVTLQHRVESEIFRDHHQLKGQINVNVAFGVVELRGEVSDEQIQALEQAARKVSGVKDVHNLLHAPGSPAKHSPASG